MDISFTSTNPAKLVRAITIRTLLSKQPKVKSIAQDLLAYLLHVPLQHGVRSLTRIITASELRKAEIYKTIHLPSREVLQLHVKPSEEGNDKVLVTNFLKEINCSNLSDKPPIELNGRTKTFNG